MKKIQYLLMLWAICLPLLAQNTTGGDDATHTLTIIAQPQYAIQNSNPIQATAGSRVNIGISLRNGYRFLCYKRGEEVISDQQRFSYTMPDEDVTLIALCEFAPGLPDNPEVPVPTYKLVTKSSPQKAGSTRASLNQQGAFKAGEQVYLQASPNQGYRFLYWKENGVEVSQQKDFSYEMPKHDVELTAFFKFDPTLPENYATNSWNETSGVLVMDDFDPYNISQTIYELTNDYLKVLQLIVIGLMSEGINTFTYLTNCSLIDLSRVSEMKRIDYNAFRNMKKLHGVILPPSIEQIESYAFAGCTGLEYITLHAISPPKVDKQAFRDLNAKEIILYVPASSVQLYEQTDIWKDFTIMPIEENLATLNIFLPDDAKDGRYKNATIQVFNVQNGQYRRNLVTDRTSYSFPLLTNCTYNVTLLGVGGAELGRWMGIDLKEEDIDLKLTDTKIPQTFDLTVKLPNGVITSQCDITWTDANSQFLGTGSRLEGVVPGQELTARFALRQQLAVQYQTPAEQTYTVAESGNSQQLTLTPFETMTITGTVIDAGVGTPIANATVVLLQTLNGQDKVVSALTDTKGTYTMDVVKSLGELTFSCDGYINNILPFDGQITQNDVKLKAITGPVISLNVSYTTNGLNPSDRKTTQYDNINDLTFSVKGHSYSSQYPQLIITDDAKAGEQLTLTVSSLTGSFLPVTTKVTIGDDLRAEANFAVKELGDAFLIIPTSTQNVTAMIYDNQGQLVRTATFPRNDRLKVAHLTDGHYTAIAMTTSEFFGTIDHLDRYVELGLIEGEDYVKGDFDIQSSDEQYIVLPAVPSFNESRFYYTGSETKFVAHKTNISPCFYVTLTTSIDLKKDISSRAHNPRLVMTLPEGIDFINGSVVRSGAIVDYMLDGQKLTIPIKADGKPVRFCVAPTESGNQILTAYLQMELGNKTVMQPIGSVTLNVKELEIHVTPITTNGKVDIEGCALPNSRVNVYEDGQFVGTTIVFPDGNWHMHHQLLDPRNLFKYNIQAVITTPEGVSIKSPTKQVLYCYTDYYVENVHMATSDGYDVYFDWNNYTVNGNTIGSTYYVASPIAIYTFYARIAGHELDMDNVESVTIHVYTDNHTFVHLDATFDPSSGLWVAKGQFTWDNLPICVSGTVSTKEPVKPVLEERSLTDAYQFYNDRMGSLIQLKTKTDELVAQMKALDVNDNEKFEQLEQQLWDLVGSERPDFSDYTPTEEELARVDADCQALFDDPYIKLLTNDANYQYPKISDLGDLLPGMEFSSADGLTAKDLMADGFDEQLTTGGTFYVKFTDEQMVFVDLKANIRIQVDMTQYLELLVRRAKGDDCSNAKKKADETNSKLGDMINEVYSTEKKVMDVISKLSDIIDKYINECFRLEAKYNKLLQNPNLSVAQKIEIKAAKLAIISKNIALHGLKVNLGHFKGPKLRQILGIASLVANITNAIRDINKLSNLICSIPDCENDPSAAESIRAQLWGLLVSSAVYYIGMAGADIAGLIALASAASAEAATAGGASMGAVPVIVGAVLELIVSWSVCELYDYVSEKQLENIKKQIAELKCDDQNKKPNNNNNNDDDDNNNNNNNNNDDDKYPTSPHVAVIHDPSGYVYEAVSSNRVEGVNATIFYKEEREDMYGDIHEEAVLWNAEEYAQQNPQFTDADGMYQWDVPQGMWQVRYRKEGYEPTQSEWLPVPPPQLEVNIPITQLRAPQVAQVHAYTDGTVELYFDKYMQPATLNNSTIYLKKKMDDEEQLVALNAITFPDEEIAYEGQEETYARTVKLTTQEDLSKTKEVILIVDRSVKSYAGVNMLDTYQQTLDVEQRISQLIADSLLMVENGTEKPVTIKAIPSEAAQGKTLIVTSCNEKVTKTDVTSVTFNEQGEATITLHGLQPGRTSMIYAIKDGTTQASSLVDVFLRTNSKVSLNLKQGWNWVSHWLCEPIMPQTTAIDQILSGQGKTTAVGSMAGYKVKTTESSLLKAEGLQLEDGEKTTQLTSGWNWVAYPYSYAARLNTAVTEAEEGDVIASQTSFAIYEGGRWTGTLTALQPGQGYLYRSKSEKPLHYIVPLGQKVTADRTAATERWTPESRRYSNTMNLVAQLYDGSSIAKGYTVGVFDKNNECRGVSQVIGDLLFITVYGNENDELNFVATEDATTLLFEVREKIPFKADLAGSLTSPVILRLVSDPTDISNIQHSSFNGQSSIFNLAGQRMSQRRQGVNIIVDTKGTIHKLLVK